MPTKFNARAHALLINQRMNKGVLEVCTKVKLSDEETFFHPHPGAAKTILDEDGYVKLARIRAKFPKAKAVRKFTSMYDPGEYEEFETVILRCDWRLATIRQIADYNKRVFVLKEAVRAHNAKAAKKAAR